MVRRYNKKVDQRNTPQPKTPAPLLGWHGPTLGDDEATALPVLAALDTDRQAALISRERVLALREASGWISEARRFLITPQKG